MTFSKKIKLTAGIYQGADTSDKHADHIIPKSKGGADSVENCQILPPLVNFKKGNTMHDLREWQITFLDEWAKPNQGPFLCVAIPGAGKTIASLIAAERFLKAGNDRRLLIVVPTDNLRGQWRGEAYKVGINLQTKEFGTNFKGDFLGGVFTYQSLDTYALLLKTICARCPTMVILDEPHHCRDKEGWGPRTKEAFELASRILLLSGTPFRTDGLRIPFVEYDGDGYCVANTRYDYPRALTDHVVRWLTFDYSKGGYKEIKDGEQQTYELNSELANEEADIRLRKILNPEGNFVADIVKEAHAQLQEIRKVIPDAAAMAVCIDMFHAGQVASVIRRITGSKPSVIVSDDEIATDNVEVFRKAKTEWLVSVKQVSEGTDIKRLQVLCYFTTAKTQLFFRQLIGRVSRVRFEKEEDAPSEHCFEIDGGAYVFLPDHPLLVEHAKDIQNAQIQALREEDDGESRARKERVPGSGDDSLFLGSYRDGTASRIIGSRQYTAEEAEEIADIARRFEMKEKKAADIFEWRKENPEARPTRGDTSGPRDDEPLEVVLDRYRRECNRKAFRLSKLVACRVEEVHSRFKPQESMRLKDLQDKLAKLNEWIDEFYERN